MNNILGGGGGSLEDGLVVFQKPKNLQRWQPVVSCATSWVQAVVPPYIKINAEDGGLPQFAIGVTNYDPDRTMSMGGLVANWN